MKSQNDYNADLFELVYAHFIQRINESWPSSQVRDQGNHMHIEIHAAPVPDPFPEITIKIYPNGRPKLEKK